MPNISVIILTSNQEAFIEKAIRSVFMQNFCGKIQVIISNDASRDRTHEIINNLLQQAPENIEIQYTLHPKNIGATPNMYDALKKVKGKYLALCEGDDYWTDENKLQMQYDFMEQNPEYAICFHAVAQVDENDNFIPDMQFSSIENRDYTALELYRSWQVHTTSVCMRTEVLQNQAVKQMLKNPDLLYFDTPLYMAASLNGKMRGNSKTMSAYRRHSAGISYGANLKRDLKHNIYDRTIGNFYGGKIKDISRWLIFKRSKDNFFESLKQHRYKWAFQYLWWMLCEYKKMGIYILTNLK